MRSPIGPVLILLGLATTVVLVLVLFQTIGMRGDLEDAREEIATLRTQVETQDGGITADELTRDLDELESSLRDWLIASGADGGFDGDPGSPAGGSSADEVLDRLDEVLAQINALDDRVDEICGNVPVC
ncbi:hypothetical protein BH23CHL9_BH23CHL9_17000 [soil metagenome]|jgi:hypothetical protein